MAFKDWGFFPEVARYLADHGFHALTFNFSGNGVEGDGNRITDFARFQANTFAWEISDLDNLISAVTAGTVGRGLDRSRLVLLGHSRGGGIALLQASRDPRVNGLVTWAGISTFDRWTRHQKEQWRAQGSLALARNSAVSPLRLGRALLDDYEGHAEEYDLIRAAARMQAPWLLLHGAADVTVAPREAERLYEAAPKGTTELALLEHAGHLFNAASPGEDHYRMLHMVLQRTVHWLNIHFKKDHP